MTINAAPAFENFSDDLMPEPEPTGTGSSWSPVCDIYETVENIVITVELPEVKKEDMYVSIAPNLLTIGCQHNAEVQRTFFLPGFVDGKQVKAEFRKGIMRVIIRKSGQVFSRKARLRIY